ncbi:MAG: proteasome-type protease [Actinomycetota bacterium]
MTYCVGLQIDKGLVFMSDTRTNSGVDNISVFKKMHRWVVPGERVVTVMSAGNLATTQSVVSQLDERTKAPEERRPSILEAPTMFQVAELVGTQLRDTIERHADEGQRAEATFNATLIVGGQIVGMPPRLFLIYPEGNFIEAGEDTPFLQIGETKYGRPILLRAYDPAMSFEDAVKLLLVSFDSTIKANLSVGLPLDLSIYETDSLEADEPRRIAHDDPYFRSISDGWGDALRSAFDSLPDFSFEEPT